MLLAAGPTPLWDAVAYRMSSEGHCEWSGHDPSQTHGRTQTSGAESFLNRFKSRSFRLFAVVFDLLERRQQQSASLLYTLTTATTTVNSNCNKWPKADDSVFHFLALPSSASCCCCRISEENFWPRKKQEICLRKTFREGSTEFN